MARGDDWWTSWDEVPQHIKDWAVNKAKIEARDPDYLRFLNQNFNPVPHEKKAKGFVFNGEGKTIVCCGDRCLSTIRSEERKMGKRLCGLCEGKIKRLGRVGYVGYSGGSHDVTDGIDNNLHL